MDRLPQFESSCATVAPGGHGDVSAGERSPLDHEDAAGRARLHRLYGPSSRRAGQGSARCSCCTQIAAGWQAGEPGTSMNRQARRGAAASDAEAAQQLQFIAEKLSIGVLLFRVHGSPLAAKGVSARPRAAGLIDWLSTRHG